MSYPLAAGTPVRADNIRTLVEKIDGELALRLRRSKPPIPHPFWQDRWIGGEELPMLKPVMPARHPGNLIIEQEPTGSYLDMVDWLSHQGHLSYVRMLVQN